LFNLDTTHPKNEPLKFYPLEGFLKSFVEKLSVSQPLVQYSMNYLKWITKIDENRIDDELMNDCCGSLCHKLPSITISLPPITSSTSTLNLSNVLAPKDDLINTKIYLIVLAFFQSQKNIHN